ncbi:gp34 [Listeria phage P35]|uniref:DNA primase n=1 Tax=Listeria phage P35 TaxID=330398 RepID=UPI00015C0230|nr:DNA primase [Listeria phage P35]AAY53219.1 gp34 [Listeria phage P35]
MFIEFEEGTKFAKEGSPLSESHEGFQDAGYLLDKTDLVIDLDFNDVSQEKAYERVHAVLDLFEIKTQVVYSNRGAHLYFKKPKGYRAKNGVCLLGIDIEPKTSTNTTNGITIKQNGIVRKMENENMRAPFPDVFKTGKFENAVSMGEGGRNNFMFRHLAMAKSVVTADDVAKIAKFINEYLFDEPLPQSELEKSVMQSLESETLFSGLMEKRIAEQVVRDYRIVKYRDSLYYFEDNQYKQDESGHILQIAYKECGDVPTKVSDEVYRHISRMVEFVDSETVFPIRVANGVIDTRKAEAYGMDSSFIPIDDKKFSPYYINIPYNAEAEAVQEVDDYLNNLTGGDEDYKKVLLEALGSTLLTDPEQKRLLAKIFIFRGNGGNGKGTLLTIISEILGRESVGTSSLEQLTNESYLYSLNGKLANLCDDVENSAIDNKKMKIIKNISTCDRIDLRKMREQAFSATLTCTLIMTSNHTLKSFEKGKSWKRRVMWMPMFSEVVKKDPRFITKLTTPKALQYWLALMVEGLNRLLDQKCTLTPSKVLEDYNKAYHADNNNALDFFATITENEIFDQPVKDVYEKYCAWFKDEHESDQDPFKSTTFSRSVMEFYPVEKKNVRIGQKTPYCYVALKKGDKPNA